jgi:hypothetical protein
MADNQRDYLIKVKLTNLFRKGFGIGISNTALQTAPPRRIAR